MEFTKIYEDTIDMVNLISAQIYEGEICAGKIMFIKDPQEFEGLCFKDYISVHDIRRTRKLLELSTEHHLIVNEHNVLGIGTTGDGNGAEFIIQGHLEWIYKNNGLELVKYKNGRYYVPTVSYKGFLNNYNISKISECFGADKARPIIEIIKSALDHEHGTILIITNDAYNEAKRLCASNRGLQCKKLNLAEETNKNFINEIIRIDGAVIIDENCFCHGIGIILDGEVVIKGSTARGARYNSAINYIAWKKRLGIEREYIAVIMSEDQTVDIITSQDQFQYIKELSTTAI